MRGAAKLQAAANEPEAGFGMDVRGGLGGDVPAPSVSAGASSAARRGAARRRRRRRRSWLGFARVQALATFLNDLFRVKSTLGS